MIARSMVEPVGPFARWPVSQFAGWPVENIVNSIKSQV